MEDIKSDRQERPTIQIGLMLKGSSKLQRREHILVLISKRI